jgi:hypothetical protein
MITQLVSSKKEPRSNKFAKLIKVYGFSAGVLIGGILASGSVSALNGFSYFLTCATCATSSNFTGAAANLARSQQSAGLYIVTSAISPATAYVQIAGQLVNVGDGSQSPVWRFEITSTVLVDASGNSLAGLSEASLQANFQSFDQMFYGVTRGAGIGQVSVPSDIAPSWVGIAEGLEVLQAKIPSLIYQQYNINQIPVGTTITVVFPDGSKVSWPHSSRQRDKWKLRSLQARISLERKENHDEENAPQPFSGI